MHTDRFVPTSREKEESLKQRRKWPRERYLQIVDYRLPVLLRRMVFSLKTSLCNKCIQNLPMLLYKIFFFLIIFLLLWKICFSLRFFSYDLRWTDCILSLNKPKTTSYGLNSFPYVYTYPQSSGMNAPPDVIHTTEFIDFKVRIQRAAFLPLFSSVKYYIE